MLYYIRPSIVLFSYSGFGRKSVFIQLVISYQLSLDVKMNTTPMNLKDC